MEVSLPTVTEARKELSSSPHHRLYANRFLQEEQRYLLVDDEFDLCWLSFCFRFGFDFELAGSQEVASRHDSDALSSHREARSNIMMQRFQKSHRRRPSVAQTHGSTTKRVYLETLEEAESGRDAIPLPPPPQSDDVWAQPPPGEEVDSPLWNAWREWRPEEYNEFCIVWWVVLATEVEDVWGAVLTRPNDVRLAQWQHDYVVGRAPAQGGFTIEGGGAQLARGEMNGCSFVCEAYDAGTYVPDGKSLYVHLCEERDRRFHDAFDLDEDDEKLVELCDCAVAELSPGWHAAFDALRGNSNAKKHAGLLVDAAVCRVLALRGAPVDTPRCHELMGRTAFLEKLELYVEKHFPQLGRDGAHPLLPYESHPEYTGPKSWKAPEDRASDHSVPLASAQHASASVSRRPDFTISPEEEEDAAAWHAMTQDLQVPSSAIKREEDAGLSAKSQCFAVLRELCTVMAARVFANLSVHLAPTIFGAKVYTDSGDDVEAYVTVVVAHANELAAAMAARDEELRLATPIGTMRHVLGVTVGGELTSETADEVAALLGDDRETIQTVEALLQRLGSIPGVQRVADALSRPAEVIDVREATPTPAGEDAAAENDSGDDEFTMF